MVTEKLVVLVKKGALMKLLLYGLLTLFVARIAKRGLLGSLHDVKAFVLEHTNNPSIIYCEKGLP